MPVNYKQGDPAWASNPYAGETMSAAGCGPTSCADLTGQNPWAVAQWMAANGLASNMQGTSHSAVPVYLRSMGYEASTLASGLAGQSCVNEFAAFGRTIQNGYCGILLMGGISKGCIDNYWTQGGHYIAIVGYKDGKYNVFDPATAQRDGFHSFEDFSGRIRIIYTTSVRGGITAGNVPAAAGSNSPTDGINTGTYVPQVYVPRILGPDKDDRNYISINKQNGANKCVAIDNKSGSVLPNCVGYAFGRFMEVLGSTPTLSTGNANDWYKYPDTYQRGKEPKVGAIACWVNENGPGHLAVVEKIYKEGSNKDKILFSTSIYPSTRFTLQLGSPPSYLDWKGYIFKGFIYNPMAASDEALGGDLYEEKNDEDDAVLRQVGYLDGTKPTTKKTNIKLSCINYTTALGAFFKGAILEPGMLVAAGGGSVDLSGIDISSQDSVAKAIFKFFLAKGLNAAATCGILGNMMQESSLRPGSFTSNPNNTYPMKGGGLVGWTDGGRNPITNFTQMVNYVGSNWANNLSGQLDYLHKQISQNFSTDVNLKRMVWDKLLTVPNNLQGAFQAREIFQTGFEGYSGEAAERNAYTKAFWNKLAIQV